MLYVRTKNIKTNIPPFYFSTLSLFRKTRFFQLFPPSVLSRCLSVPFPKAACLYTQIAFSFFSRCTKSDISSLLDAFM